MAKDFFKSDISTAPGSDAELAAKIIFFRVSGQLSGLRITDKIWAEAASGWREQPELFPVVEACFDAATEIVRTIGKEPSSGN